MSKKSKQKKSQSKAKNPKQKKNQRKKIPKEDIIEEESLEEAAEEELEEEIEEIDEEIKEKKTEEEETGEKPVKKKTEKEEKEIKNIFQRFSPHHTAILIGEAAVALIAVALIFVLLLSDNFFHNDQKAPREATPQTNSKLAGQAQKNENADTEEGQQEESAEVEKINSSDWPAYANSYYGFRLKYPTGWNKVIVKNPVRGAKWVRRYQFRKKEVENGNPFAGFDVAVYDVKNIEKLNDTEEFPAPKEGVDSDTETCQTIEGHLEESDDYPNEEIYIPSGDDCYNTALFYSLTRDEYTYNVVPVYAEDYEKAEDLRNQTIKDFPEFFESAASFVFTDILRPKPAPPKPKITAPYPVSYKKDALGRLVCTEGKHDKPSKSKTNKHRHLDMECCLDPDEYPNPWCYYDPGKYGKYLK